MPNGHRIVLLPEARLSLTTLGRATLVSLEADGTTIELFGPGKPLALLAYLAFSPRRTATREHLIDLLWADTDPERAAHALRQLVWQIRHTLGEKALVTHNGDLRLGLALDSDRDSFLAAVEAGALEEAVQRYSGDFLPALALPGGAEFEQWADIERIRLRTAFLRTGETLVRRQLAAGHVRDAQRLARRVRDVDLLNESGWRLMLEALGAGNNYVAAAMEADTLEHLLRAEEREPEPATKAALRTARQAPPEADTTQQALVAELVGREREFAAIVGAWEASRRGPARHVHITAPAGLGKTRLMHDALARLRAGGARAIYVRANPGERHIASAFAGDVAAAVARLPGAAGVTPTIASTLVALNPALSNIYAAIPERRGGEDALRSRAIALAELFLSVAEEAPLCLLLDDFHWADPQSRQILNGALGRIGSGKILIVSAARPTADLVTAAEGMSQLRLDPLTDSQTAALLGSLAQLPDEEWAKTLPSRLHASTGGSPLLILESLQLAVERGSLQFKGHAWYCPAPMRLTAELAQGAALRHRVEQLDRTSQWILLTLSSAGMPLSSALLARLAARPEDSITPLLGSLEERGLVVRAGSEWEPGHDEIAALALETATPDALRAVHSGLGKALAQEAIREPSLTLHAARHLAAGGENSVLAELWRGWIRERRRRGDRRALSDLAAELLSETGNEQTVSRLVASLPLSVRLGIDSPRRIALAAAVLLTVGGAAAVALSRPAPRALDAAFVVVVAGGSDSTGVQTVELHDGDWQGLDRIDLVRQAKRYSLLLPTDFLSPPTPRPDSGGWLVSTEYPDSGGIDLTLVRPDGSRQRITQAPGDDGGPSFSPDGRYLVFSTGRWSSVGHSDLAVLDLSTGEVRQLTRGDPSDHAAHWSPDGSRIAFLRRYFDLRSSEFCWTTVDGLTPVCFGLDSVPPEAVVGWANPLHLIVLGRIGGGGILADLDLASHQSRVLAHDVQHPHVSPDGRWIACRCTVQGEEPSWRIFPAERPSDSKPLVSNPAHTLELDFEWAITGLQTRYLDRLSIGLPTHVPVNTETLVHARGSSRQGFEVPLPVLRWWTSNRSVATIDSAGALSPHDLGTAILHVSAGGWREDSVRIVIDPPMDSSIVREDWSAGVDRNFVPYGEPRPDIVVGPEGVRSFWNRGDGSYLSGAYYRATMDPTRGLGLEARVSARLSAIQWQTIVLRFVTNLDSARLAIWDHLGRSLPIASGLNREECGFAIPGGEGAAGRQRLTVIAGTSTPVFPAPRDFDAGGWHTVRVQVFPDGRCGVALDGKPLAILDQGLPLDRRYWLDVSGQSVGTKMLVGPIDAWKGVRSGVDWSALSYH